MSDLQFNEFVSRPGVLNYYIRGSYVYGTANENSDIDVLVVIDDNYDQDFKENYIIGNYDIHVITMSIYLDMADANNIDFIETQYAPDGFKHETKQIDFTLSPDKIRRQFSKVASNSWSKAFKKLKDTEDFNEYVGKKSLFHSIRIINFAIQLLETNKIDFSAMNYIYNDIMNSNNLKEFQPLRNELKSKLRNIVPLEHQPMTIWIATINGQLIYVKEKSYIDKIKKDLNDNSITFIETDTDKTKIVDLLMIVPGNTLNYRNFLKQFKTT